MKNPFANSADYVPLLRLFSSENVCAAERSEAARKIGFGAIVIDVNFASETRQPVWLAAPFEGDGFGQFIWFETDVLSTEESRAWGWPSDQPDLLAVFAVPLLGTSDAPDWSRLIALSNGENNIPVLNSSEQNDWRFHYWTRRSRVSSGVQLLQRDAVTNLISGVQEAVSKLPEDASVRGLHVEFLSTNAPAENATGLPFFDDMTQAFRAQHNYDLLPRLQSLVANTGSDAARVRQDFWTTIAQQCRDNLSAALHDEDAARLPQPVSLCLVSARESLSTGTQYYGDVASLWREVSLPTINVESLDIGDGLLARLCASVAALHGKKQCVAQLWRGCDWSTTLGARIPAIHHLLQCGISAFIAGAARGSLFSTASQNAPSEIHQPFNAHWKGLADYLSNCGAALSVGQNGARIGVLWPQRSASTHLHPNGHRFVRWVEEDLQSTAQLLDELHFDYLLLPEDDLRDGVIKTASNASTQLLCGAEQFPLEMIVLPSVTALSRATWDKLKNFIEAGGKVACFGLLPRWSERGRDTQFEESIGTETRLTTADLYEAYTALEDPASASDYVTYPIAREFHSGGRLCCYQPRLEPDKDAARLYVRRILGESLLSAFETQSPDILYTRRVCEDGELYFVFNNREQPQRVNLRLRPAHEAVPHRHNAWNATSKLLDEWTRFTQTEGGGLSLTLSFAPQEAHFVWLEYAAEGTEEFDVARRIERTNFIVESYNDGVATGYLTESGTAAFAARDATGKMQWHYGEEASLPSPILIDEWDAQRLDPNCLVLSPTPISNGLRAEFKMAQKPASLFLCARKNDAFHKVSLNGAALNLVSTPFEDNVLWCDDSWFWFSLEGAHIGANELTIETTTRDLMLRLVGEFDLDENLPNFWDAPDCTSQFSIAPTRALSLSGGSWHEQGLPFYSGCLEYSQTISTPEAWRNCRVFLEVSQARDATEIFVNDVSSGSRFAAPYRFDLTQALHADAGNNIVIKVCNSAQSVVEPHNEIMQSGLLGPVRLVAYPLVEIRSER